MEIERPMAHVSKCADNIGIEADGLLQIAENDDGISDETAKKLQNIAEEINNNLDAMNENLDEISAIAEDADNGDIQSLHEAICEGRKQDAIDIVSRMFPDINLRSVKTQNSLFPDRVVL